MYSVREKLEREQDIGSESLKRQAKEKIKCGKM